jgi:uncharacterized C2H2 Zn-finger protein
LTALKPKFVCPECSANFSKSSLLGAHRRKTHGILGTSPAARYAQRQKALEPPQLKGPFPCEYCDFKAKDKGGLSNHQRAIHGDVSQSRTAIAIRASNPLQCPECTFVAGTVGGLGLHRLKQHGVVSERRNTELKRLARLKKKGIQIAPIQTITAVAVSSNGHHEETHVAPTGIPEAAIAFTAGRVEELLHRTAIEYDLSPRSFTARVIELVHAKTLR